MATIDQYKTVLAKLIIAAQKTTTEQILDGQSNEITFYKSQTGYLSGLRHALHLMEDATDELYGRKPASEPPQDIYE